MIRYVLVLLVVAAAACGGPTENLDQCTQDISTAFSGLGCGFGLTCDNFEDGGDNGCPEYDKSDVQACVASIAETPRGDGGCAAAEAAFFRCSVGCQF